MLSDKGKATSPHFLPRSCHCRRLLFARPKRWWATGWPQLSRERAKLRWRPWTPQTRNPKGGRRL